VVAVAAVAVLPFLEVAPETATSHYQQALPNQPELMVPRALELQMLRMMVS